MPRLRVTVVGSVNLDLVARCERLPRPGETVTDAEFVRVPGGKGANQAVAAARLGADVRFVGCVGDDDYGLEAITGLEEAGVDLSGLRVVSVPTGVALIIVAADGENQIAVAPGANRELKRDDIRLGGEDLVLCQLEIPDDAVAATMLVSSAFSCLNAAPARLVHPSVLAEADLVVVNRYEREVLGAEPERSLLAVTLGADGAVLLSGGEELARARPPAVQVVDGTAAGDAFCAALAVGIVEGREVGSALVRACAAGALTASRPGAQPSLPTAAEVDAILAA